MAQRRRLTYEPITLIAAAGVLIAGIVGLATRSDGVGELVDRTRAAAERSGSFRFKMTQKLSGPGAEAFDSVAPFTLNGAVDVDDSRSKFVTTIKAGAIKASCTYLSTAEDLYVSVHPSRRAKIGAAWLRTDARSVLEAQNFQIRPDKLYENTQGLFDDLEEAGREKVQGVPTTKYTGDVPVAKIAPGVAENPALKQFERTVPLAVYVDDDELMRRMTFEIGGGRGFALQIVMDFFDYGKPVVITPPPASQVKEGSAQQTAAACFPEVQPRV